MCDLFKLNDKCVSFSNPIQFGEGVCVCARKAPINFFLAASLVFPLHFLQTKELWTSCNNFFKDDTANRPKLCGNCAFAQNFHTRKLGEITVFFAVRS